MPLRARKRLDLKRGIVELYYGLLGVCRGRRRRREKARARERERERQQTAVEVHPPAAERARDRDRPRERERESAMTGAMFPNHTAMTIAAKAELGPCSTRMRYQRPKYRPPKEVDVAEAGAYLPLHQLRSMGVRTPSPEKPEPFSAREAAVPKLPKLPPGARSSGPLTHPRGNTKKNRTVRSTIVGPISTGALKWAPMPPRESRVLRHGRADGLKGRKGKPRHVRALHVAPVDPGSGSQRPFHAADTLRVAMAVIRAGEHAEDVWQKVAAEVGGGRDPDECRQCWDRIVRARCSVELQDAIREKDLPSLRKALGRAAALHYESSEVREAELLQAELEAMVREYDDGIEGGIDDILPWQVQQLVAQLRRGLYKAATGQDIVTMLRRWDHDGTGEINFEEFKDALRNQVKMPTASLHDEDLRALFAYVDEDDSGTVEPEELIAFLKKGSGQRLRGASRLPETEEERRAKVLKQAHAAGQLEGMAFERGSKGVARAKKKRAKATVERTEVPLKQLLDRLFEDDVANRYNILLQVNGFEQVGDVALASPHYFEALGMPMEAVELLLAEANRKEEEKVEQASPKLIEEAKALIGEWFIKMDDDGSGEITMYEATDLLNSLGPREGARLSWGELLAEIDVNRDGKITADEIEGIFLNAAPDNDEEFQKVVLTPLRDLQARGWEVVDERKKRAQAANPYWRDPENNEGGVTDLRRIGEDPGDFNHNKTLKCILTGLEAAALTEADTKKKGKQRVFSSRLAQPITYKLFGMKQDDDEDEEVSWVVNRKHIIDEPINEEDDAISAARKALAAAGVRQLQLRPVRKGWMDYDSETPRRFVILDKWRQWVALEKKYRAIVLRMTINRQELQLKAGFRVWKLAHNVAKKQKLRKGQGQGLLKGKVKGLLGENSGS